MIQNPAGMDGVYLEGLALTTTHGLHVPMPVTLSLHAAGLFISRGSGTHVQRRIDTWELILVRSGSLHMHEDHRPLDIHQHEALLLHPGRLHGGTQPYARDLSFFWLHFQLASPVGRRGRGPWAEHTLSIPQHSRPARPDRVIELFHHLLDDAMNQALTPITSQALLMLILHEVAQSPRDGTGQPVTIHPLATQAERYIAQYSHEPISTSSIASELDCSADYLGLLFRQAFGVTITQAIVRERLKDAKTMLRDSSLNINQVAQACGFHTPGYFRRLFLEHEGMTPSRYRRLHQRLYINVR